MRAYATFHARVFAPATPCSERRVLVVRESFSDAVGVGHLHLGLMRFVALAMAMGRALVFSACSSASDKWAVRGKSLWKNAQPFDCAKTHLSVADYYEGFGGIDYRWSAARHQLMSACGTNETSLNLMSLATLRAAPERHGGGGGGGGPDVMACDKGALARCPDLRRLFGDGDGAGSSPTAASLAAAPLLALYNARRDGGAHGLPSLQAALSRGAASLPAPNGSSLGVLPAPSLRDALSCPPRCQLQATFQPGTVLRTIIDGALRGLHPSQPLLCAHLRTMWVDDGRCFPNPRGCQRRDFHTFFHTSNVSTGPPDEPPPPSS